MLRGSQEKLKRLLETENQQLKKLNDIVLQSINEEKLLSQNCTSSKRSIPLSGVALQIRWQPLVEAGLSLWCFF
jgi:hypothetical protein